MNKYNKVPEISLIFWLTKLISTGQGESISDMSAQLFHNQIIGAAFTVIWSTILFLIFLYLQMKSEKYRPLFYWLTVALLAVFGTILADGLSAGAGVPHFGTMIIFAILMLISFVIWFAQTKSLSIHDIKTRKAECFYWLTVLFSFALGTAMGDWAAFDLGLGLLNTGLILGAIFLGILYYRLAAKPKENSFMEILSFWLAYILTRPIGASFADYFGYKWMNGILGNRGMSVIWLVLFVIFLTIIVVKYNKGNKSEAGK